MDEPIAAAELVCRTGSRGTSAIRGAGVSLGGVIGVCEAGVTGIDLGVKVSSFLFHMGGCHSARRRPNPPCSRRARRSGRQRAMVACFGGIIELAELLIVFSHLSPWFLM